MRYILDTCVISEIIKKAPEQRVVSWLTEQNESNLYLSTITIGELVKGIRKLKKSVKRQKLENWLKEDLMQRFNNKILPIDREVAFSWGTISAHQETIGRPISALDMLIAATALAHDMIVVTRNWNDFNIKGVSVFNPWEKK